MNGTVYSSDCRSRLPNTLIEIWQANKAIHFRVAESMHIPLTTQLYFKDDPYVAKDPWASGKPSLAIDLKQDGKTLHGTFDIALARGF